MTEPLPPRPEPRRQWSRRLRDRLATLLITAGGLGVVAAVLAIGVFLALEVAPLFLAAEASLGWGELWREYWQPGTLPGETPAYGMLPLAWGTLKAAFWALLFAIPLALGAAIHSALYMPPRLRSRLKPTLEMMEAMPGVVVGFVAGLVLAPWVERHLAGALALALVLPAGMLLAGMAWTR